MKIEGKLNKNGLLNCLDILNENDLEKSIDLSDIEFADVFGLISIALLIKKEVKDNNRIDLIMPHNVNVSNYLHISGFIDYLKDFVEIKYNGFNLLSKIHGKIEINVNKDYIPLQIINNREDVEMIIDKIIIWLKMKGVNESKVNGIFTLLLELFGNALDHSDSKSGVIFAMQKYQTDLMISIADFGIGIKASLEKSQNHVGQFNSSQQAMQYIFTNKNYISCEDEKGRGNGFFWLNKLSKETQMEFYIYSRDGFYESKYNKRKK